MNNIVSPQWLPNNSKPSLKVFLARPSWLAVLYLAMFEAVWLVILLLSLSSLPVKVVAVVASLAIFLFLLKSYFRWAATAQVACLISMPTGWFLAQVKVNSLQDLYLTQQHWQKIQVLPETLIFPHLILLRYRYTLGGSQQQLLWLDSLGDLVFRDLARMIYETKRRTKKEV